MESFMQAKYAIHLKKQLIYDVEALGKTAG